MTTTAPPLDLAALDAIAPRRAVTLPGLELPALAEVLALAMPGVRHSHRILPSKADEHCLVDPEGGSAVRVVIWWDRCSCRSHTEIAELGPRLLWDELVALLEEWEQNSRTIPERWMAAATAEQGEAVR